METFTSALDVASAVRRRTISPVEVLDACLAQVDKLNPELNAVVWRNDEEVRAEAQALADALASGVIEPGPFAGVPIPVKDLTPVEGWPVTYGSFGAPQGPSIEGELVTELLRAAGFLLCGRTNTPEFGPLTVAENSRYGITRNPWDPQRSPGGSSGGASAAVAAGMFPVAHANDGGGSIRIPASCCGLVGLKPGRARIPARAPGWFGLAVEGVVCRTVADAAAILDSLSGPDLLSWENAPAPERPFAAEVGAAPGALRIALCVTSALGVPVEAAPRAAVESTGRILEDLGHHVTVLDEDVLDPTAIGPFLDVINTGYGDFRDVDWSNVEPHNAVGHAAGQAVDGLTVVRALHDLQSASRSVVARWGRDFDILVTPTMSIEPPVAGAVLAEAHAHPDGPAPTALAMAAFTAAFNITGQPAVSLPLHWSDAGLPVGVQFVGGPWQEWLLVRLASQVEEASPWSERRPPLSSP
ncbi:MAG TPA: amidase [Acidimicrobiales bacterium]|nr:amidase [Acidimicrobiales bacterium]